jgi:hypothetical protein
MRHREEREGETGCHYINCLEVKIDGVKEISRRIMFA